MIVSNMYKVRYNSGAVKYAVARNLDEVLKATIPGDLAEGDYSVEAELLDPDSALAVLKNHSEDEILIIGDGDFAAEVVDDVMTSDLRDVMGISPDAEPEDGHENG